MDSAATKQQTDRRPQPHLVLAREADLDRENLGRGTLLAVGKDRGERKEEQEAATRPKGIEA